MLDFCYRKIQTNSLFRNLHVWVDYHNTWLPVRQSLSYVV